MDEHLAFRRIAVESLPKNMEARPHSKQILQADLKISAAQVRWYFIEDFYDGPIAGLAMYSGRIVRFCTFPEDIPAQHIFVLHALDEDELREALEDKAEFEEMVGTHWSYDESGAPLPRVLRSEASRKEYYGRQAERPSPSREPGDLPVLAWFDLRDEPGQR